MLDKKKEHAHVCSGIYSPGKKTKIDTGKIKASKKCYCTYWLKKIIRRVISILYSNLYQGKKQGCHITPGGNTWKVFLLLSTGAEPLRVVSYLWRFQLF